MDATQALTDALTLPLEQVDELAREDEDGTPGYGRLLNPAKADLWMLRWLAQLAGVRWQGPSSETLRQLIIDRPAARRGQPGQIVAAAQSTLTGTRTVRLIERDTGMFHFTVVTRPAETPNPAATVRAIRSELPTGFQFSHVTSDAPLINEGTKTIDSVAVSMDSATPADVTA